MNFKRFLIAALMVLVLALTIFAVRTLAEREGGDQGLAGSWMTTVNIPSAPAPFKALITFTEDGSVLETDAARFPMMISAGPGHGSWIRTGNREFSFNFVRLLFDPSGNFMGTFAVRGSLHLDKKGNQYTDTFTFDALDPDGHPLPIAGDGQSQGSRITLETGHPATASGPGSPGQPPGGGGAAGGGNQ